MFVVYINFDNNKTKYLLKESKGDILYNRQIHTQTDNILNLFIQDPRTTSMVYAYLAGTVLLLITLVIYFKHLITIRNKFVFKYNLLAWISIGLVVFHGIYFPIKIIKEFFTDLYAAAFRDVHIAIVICMYILFCIGFIVGKRRAFR